MVIDLRSCGMNSLSVVAIDPKRSCSVPHPNVKPIRFERRSLRTERIGQFVMEIDDAL